MSLVVVRDAGNGVGKADDFTACGGGEDRCGPDIGSVHATTGKIEFENRGLSRADCPEQNKILHGDSEMDLMLGGLGLSICKLFHGRGSRGVEDKN